jgi:hypothetical protein
MANPRVNLGSLNLLASSLQLAERPELLITPSNCTKAGITVSFNGDVTTSHGVMVGIVQSPQPYVEAVITATILKTQVLAAAWKLAVETSGDLGEITVFTDAPDTLPFYTFDQASITRHGDIATNGGEPGFQIVITARYVINSDNWNN